MNFLFHMILSGDDEQLLVGNFMGDFVKGMLYERFPPRIRQGVLLHRKIDSQADRHPIYRQSRQRLSRKYGLFRGVMLDLFYDYFLANDWPAWCDEPLPDYLARTRAVIERHQDVLPPKMHRLLPIIFDEFLPLYGTIDGIGNALSRTSRRFSRPNPLCGGEEELREHLEDLRSDFRVFTPELFQFAHDLIDSETLSGNALINTSA